MFTITAKDTDYSQIATGKIEKPFEEFVKEWDLEVVERSATSAVVRAEWGNGEGYDEYVVTFETGFNS